MRRGTGAILSGCWTTSPRTTSGGQHGSSPIPKPSIGGERGSGSSGTRSGRPWETLLIEVERIEPIGDDRVLALLRFHGRGREGVEVTLEYANLLTIENGMGSLNVGFADWQSALEAAGLRE
jgi:hypothetical protein